MLMLAPCDSYNPADSLTTSCGPPCMVRSLYKINLICHGDYFLVVKTLQVGPQSMRRAGFNASATVLLNIR